ncbi:MAG: hypothetical protein AAB597_00050 [Patescibacteria group bacterium]
MLSHVWISPHETVYGCEGPDAKNDAKVLAQRIRRERWGETLITITPFPKSSFSEGRYRVEVKIIQPVKTISEVAPSKEYSHLCYIRSPNPRREKKPSRFLKPTDDRDEYDLLEERLAKSPAPHRSGWKDAYRPTRERYWRPKNNNWKGRRKTKYRIK